MPARKPKSMISRHETKAEQQARTDRESAVRPEKRLSLNAPARLKGMRVAQAAWRRIMRIYDGLEGEIVTLLDQELLIDYCVLIEQLAEMDELRRSAMLNWRLLQEAQAEHIKAGERDEAIQMAKAVLSTYGEIVKIDARADRKRALIHQKQQSLYLTPRARAGFAPAQKSDEDDLPKSELEELLDDVGDYLNCGEK